jgi:hypothetical protein
MQSSGVLARKMSGYASNQDLSVTDGSTADYKNWRFAGGRLRKDHSITAVNPTENTMSCPSRLEVMSVRWSR